MPSQTCVAHSNNYEFGTAAAVREAETGDAAG